MSDLVGNPDDLFSSIAAHMLFLLYLEVSSGAATLLSQHSVPLLAQISLHILYELSLVTVLPKKHRKTHIFVCLFVLRFYIQINNFPVIEQS